MWFWWGLLTAILSAVSVVVNKKVLTHTSTLITTWSLFALTLPLVAVLALWSGSPEINRDFLIGVTVSGTVFAFTKVAALLAIKGSLLSKIAPLNAFGAAVTYVVGLLVLSETVRPIPLLGLFSVILGAYILNAEGLGRDLLKPFKVLATNTQSRLYMVSVIAGGAVGVFDKLAVVNTNPVNPIYALMAENIIITLVLTPILMVKKPGWMGIVKTKFGNLLTAGIVYKLAIIAFFYGLSTGPAALLVGVKKLQIFFTLLLSWLMFGDKPSKHSWTATAIMILGVILIKL